MFSFAHSPRNTPERNGRVFDNPVVKTEVSVKHKKEVVLVDVQEKTIMLESKKFPLQDEKGFDAELGLVFWSILTYECSGKESKSLIYEGKPEFVTDRTNDHQFVQVTHSGYDFQILVENKIIYICSFLSQNTSNSSSHAYRRTNHHYKYKPRLFPNKSRLVNVRQKINCGKFRVCAVLRQRIKDNNKGLKKHREIRVAMLRFAAIQ